MEFSDEQVVLLNKQGTPEDDDRWHRIRVPLRPSANTMRLYFPNCWIYILMRFVRRRIFHATAPGNSTVSVSNIRLVNKNDEEVPCKSVKTGPGMNSRWLKGKALAYADNNMELLSPLALDKSTVAPFLRETFNPLAPMLLGILPIVPVVDRQRLTAMQSFVVTKIYAFGNYAYSKLILK